MKSVKNYVYTERAHFMCPNMHFGIMAKIESNYDEGQLKQSIDTLQKAHPFLQSLIAEETDTGRFYYQIQDYLNIITLAKRVASQVINICQNPQKEMLVLACYIHMQPELIDAVAISTLGEFRSKAGTFIGRNMFGYGSQNGYSITNLGKIESNIIAEAIFIPPASPANKKTWGVLTVNSHMKICVSNLIRER